MRRGNVGVGGMRRITGLNGTIIEDEDKISFGGMPGEASKVINYDRFERFCSEDAWYNRPSTSPCFTIRHTSPPEAF